MHISQQRLALCVQPLAELVTATGRDILQATVDLVEGELGLEVRAPWCFRKWHAALLSQWAKT